MFLHAWFEETIPDRSISEIRGAFMRIIDNLKYFVMPAMGLSLLICGCGKSENLEVQNTMKISSENLSDGVWDTEITNTAKGRNISPELTWSAVPGAEEYVIYMIDPDGGNWIHWIASGITGTHVDAGEQVDNRQYVGPYPPSGTHHYIVTVYALSSRPDNLPGRFDSSNRNPGIIVENLDTVNGKSGNILASGTLEGTYTVGD